MREAVVVLLVLYTACLASGQGSCALVDDTVSHVSYTGCSIQLGTRKVCKETNTCESKTLPRGGIYPSIQCAHRQVYHCKIGSYRMVKGTVSRNDILATSGCSGYTGDAVRYKYVDATACVCDWDKTTCM